MRYIILKRALSDKYKNGNLSKVIKNIKRYKKVSKVFDKSQIFMDKISLFK